MNQLTHDVKIAILRILSDIVNADSIIHEKELDYMNELAISLGFKENYENEVNSLVTLQALSIVRTLDMDTKEMIAQFMGKMILIDEDINYNEVKLYNAICESCNIKQEFNIEDYPYYSLSGAYVNPEELI